MNRTLARYAVALCAALPLVAASETSSYAKSPGMNELTRAGQLGLGFSGSFNYTWLSNDTLNDSLTAPSGATANNSTLFLLLSPELGYFFSDRAQITFGAGGLARFEVSYDLSDPIAASLAYVYYHDGAAFGPFYGFTDHDRLMASLRWDFTLY